MFASRCYVKRATNIPEDSVSEVTYSICHIHRYTTRVRNHAFRSCSSDKSYEICCLLLLLRHFRSNPSSRQLLSHSILDVLYLLWQMMIMSMSNWRSNYGVVSKSDSWWYNTRWIKWRTTIVKVVETLVKNKKMLRIRWKRRKRDVAKEGSVINESSAQFNSSRTSSFVTRLKRSF